jgi:hypothetical protein
VTPVVYYYKDRLNDWVMAQKRTRDYSMVDTTNSVNDTLDARGKVYGDYGDVAKTVQGLKTVAHQAAGWEKLTPVQKESIEMIVHKIGRIVSGGDPNYADNWHDIAGYAKLAEERASHKTHHTTARAYAEGITNPGTVPMHGGSGGIPHGRV